MHNDWQEQAKCKEVKDTVNFFPDPSDKEGIKAAKSVCQECPVRQQCHVFASLHENTVGVFGGEFFELKEESNVQTITLTATDEFVATNDSEKIKTAFHKELEIALRDLLGEL